MTFDLRAHLTERRRALSHLIQFIIDSNALSTVSSFYCRLVCWRTDESRSSLTNPSSTYGLIQTTFLLARNYGIITIAVPGILSSIAYDLVCTHAYDDVGNLRPVTLPCFCMQLEARCTNLEIRQERMRYERSSGRRCVSLLVPSISTSSHFLLISYPT